MNLRKVPVKFLINHLQKSYSFILKLWAVLGPKLSCNKPRLLFIIIRASNQLAKNRNLSTEGVEIITHKARERFFIQLKLKGLKMSGGRTFSCFLLCCVQLFK